STLIDAISGMVPLAAGEIRLAGSPIERLAPHRRARAGIGRMFQALDLFEDLTVEENLSVAGARDVEAAATVVGLAARLADRPAAMTHADRRRLALGRALAAKPLLVLLDEPAAGLDRPARDEIAAAIRAA